MINGTWANLLILFSKICQQSLACVQDSNMVEYTQIAFVSVHSPTPITP